VPLRVVVAGAGAIGCFVGGLLAAGGAEVTLLARRRIREEIRAHGLTLTDYAGMAIKVPSEALSLTEDPACMAGADLILVTVKSHDTAAIAAAIKAHSLSRTPVVSLQNGLGNRELMVRHLPAHDIRAGMVPFNVVPLGQGCFHRASSGAIVIGAGRRTLAETLTVPQLPFRESAEITRLQWGKFLVNLNNALNALSGLPLQAQLRDRGWRRLMAAQWREALQVLRADGLSPLSTTRLPVGLVPAVLRLPTPVFTRIASALLQIDPQARTSMAHDLLANRPTEIDALQGEVIRRGASLGIQTPISARIHELVQLAETAAEGLPHLPVRAILSDG
jgi:2-dehydropantoate 2-reductase